MGWIIYGSTFVPPFPCIEELHNFKRKWKENRIKGTESITSENRIQDLSLDPKMRVIPREYGFTYD